MSFFALLSYHSVLVDATSWMFSFLLQVINLLVATIVLQRALGIQATFKVSEDRRMQLLTAHKVIRVMNVCAVWGVRTVYPYFGVNTPLTFFPSMHVERRMWWITCRPIDTTSIKLNRTICLCFKLGLFHYDIFTLDHPNFSFVLVRTCSQALDQF